MKHSEWIAVLDFGSQYAQLIARRVRELNVYSEIIRCDTPAAEIGKRAPKGIIMSGGPASVYGEGAPRCDAEILRLGIPVMGICYGMQIACMHLGCEVSKAGAREYGRREIDIIEEEPLFKGLGKTITVWMSHGDQVGDASDELITLASTPTCPHAAVRHKSAPFYGLQFHPEVTHTPKGLEVLRNFLYVVCGCKGEWKMSSFIEATVKDIRKRVGGAKVVCGLSGGVDSSVVACLLHDAIGERLECIFVDNGLLRKGEFEQVVRDFGDNYHVKLHAVDASKRFLDALKGVDDPEKKRKIIGALFIEVFKETAEEIKDAHFLAQGTIYPDVIESSSPLGGPSATIKSHHNVGGLPEELGFELIEPMRELFKDEVRRLGEELGMKHGQIWRHPFPGPGLAIRCPGEVTEEKLAILREADYILIEELRNADWYDKVAQAFAVILPVRTVGVMGDERTYEHVIALRVIDTVDFMTADFSRLPYDLLGRIASRITNEVRGVNRVVYDISTKPPSTICWE
ncbi:MAG: glutamine-hydrolyzing GMP synthase [Planctomycetota bacterium]